MLTFHVDRQSDLTQNPERCYFQNAPSLWTVNAAYGNGTAQEWLVYQITNLSEFSGARAKLTDTQLNETVQLIVDHYGFLNMAEVMLFCRLFKCGKFDKFYGTVDPMAIMQGINTFCRDIRAEKDRYVLERKTRRQEVEKEKDRREAERFQEKCAEHGVTPLQCVRKKALFQQVMEEIRQTNQRRKSYDNRKND